MCIVLCVFIVEKQGKNTFWNVNGKEIRWCLMHKKYSCSGFSRLFVAFFKTISPLQNHFKSGSSGAVCNFSKREPKHCIGLNSTFLTGQKILTAVRRGWAMPRSDHAPCCTCCVALATQEREEFQNIFIPFIFKASHSSRGLFCFTGAYERKCRYLCRKSNSVVVSVG